MTTKGDRPTEPGVEPPDQAKPKKAVGKIALKKKPSRPPWAQEVAREVPAEKLTPVEPPPPEEPDEQ